ncbi:type I restriction enzyme S subunit [Bradyrhizobium sp. USDA 4503]
MKTLQERVHSAAPPVHWSLNKLHHVFHVRKGLKNTGMQEENLLSLSYGRIIQKDIDAAEGLLPESFETYQLVEPGNIVMRLTDLQNDKRSLRQGLVKERGIITSAYDALELGKDHDPRFWAFALLALDLAKYYYSLGGGVRQSIKFADFPNDWIATPDLPTQNAIANFLDRETARIDQLIEKKQRLAELLIGKQEALRDTLVCKGLNREARYKESGVDWLGQVPEHWTVCRFNRLISSKVDYRGRTPEKVNDGIFLVTARNIRTGKIDYERSQEFTTEEDWQKLSARGKPKIGDVLFTTEAPLGNIAQVDRLDVAFAQRIMKFRANEALVSNNFLAEFMMSASFQRSLNLYASGSTASGIKSERMAHLFGLVPPPEEQDEIVRLVRAKSAQAEATIEPLQRSIDRSREFRAALITAAVVGAIDVTAWGMHGTAKQRLEKIQEAVQA